MKLLLIFFFITYPLFNNQFIIVGKIIDNHDKQSISGARIILNNNDTTFSDLNGYFTFYSENYINNINISFISYENINESFFIQCKEKTFLINPL